MRSNDNKLTKILNNHSNWILSLGKRGTKADFNKWNLDEADLNMASLPFAKLHLTSLRNAILVGANFRQAELLKANLTNANLDAADLEGANISNCDLSFSKCRGTNFAGANLEDANLEGAILFKTNFTGANLRGARFIGADLSFAQIVDADIEGADFREAKIEAVNFEGTNFGNNIFGKTHLKVANINENLPKDSRNDNYLSNPLQNETTSSESGMNNHKSNEIASNRSPNDKSSKKDLFMDLNVVKSSIIEEVIIDLMESVKSKIQIDQVKAICSHQYFIEEIETIDFKHGDIVTHNGQVAFKLDFEITYNLGLLLDRKGKLINDCSSIAAQIEK